MFKHFDPSTIPAKDFFVNGIFFVADIVLISILLPILLAIIEKQKWAAARVKIGEHSAAFLDFLNSEFESLADSIYSWRYETLPTAMKKHSDAYTEEGIKRQRIILMKQLTDGVPYITDYFDKKKGQYLQEMHLLAPAFNSAILIKSVEFFECAVRPFSLALADLNYRILKGPEDLSDLRAQKFDISLYNELLFSLEALLKVTKTKYKYLNDEIVLIRNKAGQKSNKRNVFPNHPPAYKSVNKIYKTLNSSIEEPETP